jgi:hypothetical protein
MSRHLHGRTLLDGRGNVAVKWFVCAFTTSLLIRIHDTSAASVSGYGVENLWGCSVFGYPSPPTAPARRHSHEWKIDMIRTASHSLGLCPFIVKMIAKPTSDIQVHFKFISYQYRSI